MNSQAKTLTTTQAHITTVSVEIKALKIGPKQMTQAVFRQLPLVPLVDPFTGQLRGVPWGTVHYFWGDCAERDHLHVVWQRGNQLCRACEGDPKRPQWQQGYTVLKDDLATLDARIVAAAYVGCGLFALEQPTKLATWSGLLRYKQRWHSGQTVLTLGTVHEGHFSPEVRPTLHFEIRAAILRWWELYHEQAEITRRNAIWRHYPTCPPSAPAVDPAGLTPLAQVQIAQDPIRSGDHWTRSEVEPEADFQQRLERTRQERRASLERAVRATWGDTEPLPDSVEALRDQMRDVLEQYDALQARAATLLQTLQTTYAGLLQLDQLFIAV